MSWTCPVTRRALVEDAACPDGRAALALHLGRRPAGRGGGGEEELDARRHQLASRWQVHPQLVQLRVDARVGVPHLLVEHPAACRHPLHRSVAVSHPAALRVAVDQPRAAGKHIRHRLEAAVRVRRKALWHDGCAKERPQEVERSEGVPVMHQEDKGVGFARVELDGRDAAAEGVLQPVRPAAERAR